MRKLMIGLFFYGLISTTSVLGANPTLLDHIELKNHDTLVFLGDSITRQCLYTQYVEDFYYTRYPKLRLRFYNAGVGGDRAADTLLRFDRDVAPFKPKFVTLLLGMNDGSFEQFKQKTFDTYEKDITLIIKKITALGAQTILISPTMFDVRAYRSYLADGHEDDRVRSPHYNGVMASYGSWFREVAFKEGFGFVDMHGPFNHLTAQQRKSNPDFTMTIEGIHPTPVGHMIMAFAFLREMNNSDTVSTIHLLQEDGTWQVKTTHGIATQLQITDHISFTFIADSLPWIVPTEATLGYQLIKAGSTLSRETLRVSDLPQGRYQLCIDKTPIGTYDYLEPIQEPKKLRFLVRLFRYAFVVERLPGSSSKVVMRTEEIGHVLQSVQLCRPWTVVVM